MPRLPLFKGLKCIGLVCAFNAVMRFKFRSFEIFAAIGGNFTFYPTFSRFESNQ